MKSFDKLLESLPPYSEIIKEMKKKNVVKIKNEEELLSGSQIIIPEQANAVIFTPNYTVAEWKAKGTDISRCIHSFSESK